MNAPARVAALAAWIALAGGCEPAAEGAPEPIVVDLRGDTMGTTWHVRYVGTGGFAEVRDLRARIESVLDEIDATFSTWNPDSEISRFNAAPFDRPFAASAEFAAVTQDALTLAERTGGAYDPTARPLLALFGFTGGSERRIPAAAEIADALTRCGYDAVTVVAGASDATGAQARIERRAPRQLELSSIAKGYGVERVAAAIADAGHPDHFVEIGGEVEAAGHKPDGEPWRVGIERPPADASVPAARAVQTAVELDGAAVATSGSYRNFVESGSVSAHHVLDARTGRNPDHDVVAVSVRARGCALADALATALLVVGPDRAEALLERYRQDGEDVVVLFLSAADDGAIVERSFGWPAHGD